jgi:hypothetical protein
MVVAWASVGADPAVSIEGGPSEDGHQYTWTVRNDGAKAITSVEFPHYNGDLPNEVRHWQLEMTEQVGAGGGGRVGVLVYKAKPPYRGLPAGQSETFGLRVAPAGAVSKAATVTVRFADGTVVPVSGVLCPMPEPWVRRNIPLIGLAACLVLFILIRQLRRRPTRAGASDEGPPGEGGP